MRSDGHHVVVGDRAVPLCIHRHARAKGYRLRLDRSGSGLRLTIPLRASERSAVAWANAQSGWVADQLGRIEPGSAIGDGVMLSLEGRRTRVVLDPGAPRRVTFTADELIVGGPPDHAADRLRRWLRERARSVLTVETRDLADRNDLVVRSVAIGDAATRWGSCTAAGAIRYSWRLILAPPEVRIATVAHEVAHLRHLDHSAAFHAFHRAICPSDTVAARAWLRTNGAALHRIGL